MKLLQMSSIFLLLNYIYCKESNLKKSHWFWDRPASDTPAEDLAAQFDPLTNDSVGYRSNISRRRGTFSDGFKL